MTESQLERSGRCSPGRAEASAHRRPEIDKVDGSQPAPGRINPHPDLIARHVLQACRPLGRAVGPRLTVVERASCTAAMYSRSPGCAATKSRVAVQAVS